MSLLSGSFAKKCLPVDAFKILAKAARVTVSEVSLQGSRVVPFVAVVLPLEASQLSPETWRSLGETKGNVEKADKKRTITPTSNCVAIGLIHSGSAVMPSQIDALSLGSQTHIPAHDVFAKREPSRTKAHYNPFVRRLTKGEITLV
jgi:hypothetical protein